VIRSFWPLPSCTVNSWRSKSMSRAFEQAHPRAVHQGSHEAQTSLKPVQDLANLVPAQDQWDVLRSLGPRHGFEARELAFQNVAVRRRMGTVERAISTNEGRVWPRLLGIAVLSFPTVALSLTCFVVGSLTGVAGVKDASVSLFPLGSLLGLLPITFGGFAASDLMGDKSVPRRAVHAAWFLVVIGAFLKCGLVAALMTPGLVELP
jgi:hypothetical protein